MRCPQCSKRNSVAATECGECGFRFEKKPLPFQTKYVLGSLAALILLWGAASALLPRITDNQPALTKAAKLLAAGPKSQNDANRLTADFDRALQDVLKRLGTLKDAELTKQLQAELPASFFEVHIFPLSGNIKLVEVDNVLHVSDYFVQLKPSETAVLPVSALEVFDDGATINDPAGKFLVLLGHTAGQSSHRPTVKLFALSAGEITDLTDKLVPKLPGEGSAAFGRNKQDINANLSLLSIGQAENVFSAQRQEPAPVEDETVRYKLLWQNGHYWLQSTSGKGQLATLYSLAKCMKDPSLLNHNQTLLSAKAKKQFLAIKRGLVGELNFVIAASQKEKSVSKQASTGKAVYTLTNAKLVAKIELEKRSTGNRTWGVGAIEVNSTDKGEEGAQLASNETPVTESSSPEATKETAQGSQESERVFTSEKTTEKTMEKTEKTEKTETTETATKEQPTESSSADKQTGEEKTSQTATEKSESTNQSSPAVASIRSSSNTVILRKGPGTNFGVIDQISKGASVQVLGQQNGWYKVRANGKDGFVYAGLLEYKQPDACTVATIKQGKGVTDDRNRQLASLQVGDRLVVLGGIKDNKYKVQLANGKVGYVDKDALDVTIDAPPLVP